MKKRIANASDKTKQPKSGRFKRSAKTTKVSAKPHRKGAKHTSHSRKRGLPAAARAPRRFTKRWLEAIQLPVGMMMASSSCSENVEIMEVSFGYNGGTAYQWPVKSDFDGSAYTAPQWTSWRSTTPDRRWPVLYKRNTRPKIGALLYVHSFPSQPDYDHVSIRAFGHGGAINIPATAIPPASVDTANHTVLLDFVLTDNPLMNQVGRYGQFIIEWEICWDATAGSPLWEPCCSSEHEVFVCLDTPPLNTLLFHTIVYYACLTTGATSIAQARADTWAHFANRQIYGLDHVYGGRTRLLYYYKPYTTIVDSAAAMENLLNGNYDSARCGAWARFLYEAFKVNSITSLYGEVWPTSDKDDSDDIMLIINWAFSLGGQVETANDGSALGRNDMFPFPPWIGSPPLNNQPYGAYRHATNLPSEKGQGSELYNGGPPLNYPPDNAPSQKLHFNHALVLSTVSPGSYELFDPSYGAMYSGSNIADAQADFAFTAIAAYGTNWTPSSGHSLWTLASKSSRTPHYEYFSY